MADTSAASDKQAVTPPQLNVRGQYIKDLSFEAPKGPFGPNPQQTAPKMEVNVDLGAQKVAEDHYELELKISVKAGLESEVLFISELSYAGLFQITEVSEDQLQPMLFIDCAFILFPFARRVISDVTRDGGFPPLMLEPIDFHGLYVKRAQQAQEEQAATAKAAS